jgi:hypothetical protein
VRSRPSLECTLHVVVELTYQQLCHHTMIA